MCLMILVIIVVTLMKSETSALSVVISQASHAGDYRLQQAIIKTAFNKGKQQEVEMRVKHKQFN